MAGWGGSRVGYAAIAGLLVFYTLGVLAVHFYGTPEVKEQANTLTWFGYPAIIIAILATILGYKNFIPLLREEHSVKDAVLSYVIGTLAGIGTAIFMTGGLKNIVEAFGITYVPMSGVQLVNQTTKVGAVKLDAVHMQLVGGDPKSHAILSYIFNTFFVALHEEVLMATVTAFLLTFFGGKFVVDSLKELNASPGLNALLVRSVILFPLLHMFAYTNLFQHFVPGYFISAAVGSMIFCTLLYWRGLIAAIVAHGTYNFIISTYQATGATWMFKTLGIILLAVVGVYAAYEYVLKPRLAKLKI